MGQIMYIVAAQTVLPDGPGTANRELRYVARPYRYSVIDATDLADHISMDSRIERSKIQVITDSLIKQIEEMVLNGHAIKVPHLGIFRPALRNIGGAQENEEDVTGSQYAARVSFLPSSELKNELKATRLSKAPKSATVSLKELLQQITGTDADLPVYLEGLGPVANIEPARFLLTCSYDDESVVVSYNGKLAEVTLQNKKIDKVYASPLSATATAAELNERFGQDGANIKTSLEAYPVLKFNSVMKSYEVENRVDG